MKQLKFDFYRVLKGDPERIPFDLSQALLSRFEQPLPERTERVRGDAYRLARLQKDSDQLVGDFIRINLDQPAMVAGTSAAERSVTNSDDEGMATAVAFLFDPQSHTLVFQRAKGGLSVIEAAYYLGSGREDDPLVMVDPILRSDVETMLTRMERPRKIEFAASVGELSPDQARSDSLRRFIDIARSTGSRTMHLELSSGGKRGSFLDIGKILEFVKDCLKFRNDGRSFRKLRQLRVKGDFGSEGGPELLDLLDASLVSVQPIQPTRDIEEFYQRRVQALRAAWRANVRNV